MTKNKHCDCAPSLNYFIHHETVFNVSLTREVFKRDAFLRISTDVMDCEVVNIKLVINSTCDYCAL